MNKIDILNTNELNKFLNSNETGQVTVPYNTNFLLFGQPESAEYITELEALAANSWRSLHLR
jgi:hypothetical protein